MKTVICAMLFSSTPIGWPSVSGYAEAEPWVEPIGLSPLVCGIKTLDD